jgi:hypothetical protein
MQTEPSIRNKLESRRNFCIQSIQKIESKYVTKRDHAQSAHSTKTVISNTWHPAPMNYIIPRVGTLSYKVPNHGDRAA